MIGAGYRVCSRIPLLATASTSRVLFVPHLHVRAFSGSTKKPVGDRFWEWVGKRLEVLSKQLIPSPIPTDKDSLRDFIKSPTLQGKLKKDPADRESRVKLANNKAKFKRVGRDAALEGAYKAMATRLEQRRENKGLEGNRLNNPLPATLTTTGGGKSFFLDELGALHPADLENFCSNPEMKNILQNSVAVPITFNGTTPFMKEIDEISDSSLGLALRGLYSYFIGDTMQFKDFVAQMRPLFNELSLAVAIECIMEHSNKGVLLLVDEIMKSGGENENLKLINGRVSEIGKCLDMLTTQFNVVLTTLNMLATDRETKSGRMIGWITLAPPTLPEAVSLFGEDAVCSPVLRQCIADCNGHHRSLETLKVIWEETKLRRYTYPMLIQELGKRMEHKYSQLTIELIRAALRGERVPLAASPDGIYTYSEYLARGFYLNAPDQSSFFVPRISPLQLLLYALDRTRTDTGGINPPDAIDTRCAQTILSLFHLEPNFSWQQYEQFHANWEVLYRLLFPGKKHVTDIYRGVLAPGTRNPAFDLSPKRVDILSWSGFFPQTLPKQTPKPAEQTIATAKHESATIDKLTPADTDKLSPADRQVLEQISIVKHEFSEADLAESVIMSAANNPGFDLVFFEKETGGVDSEPLIFCVECRFSDPESETKLSKGDVARKRFLTYRQFSPHFLQGAQLCGYTLKKENLFLVICVFRETNQNVRDHLPYNTIVLDQQQLEDLYTPSLATRSQFISSEEENRQLQQKQAQ